MLSFFERVSYSSCQNICVKYMVKVHKNVPEVTVSWPEVLIDNFGQFTLLLQFLIFVNLGFEAYILVNNLANTRYCNLDAIHRRVTFLHIYSPMREHNFMHRFWLLRIFKLIISFFQIDLSFLPKLDSHDEYRLDQINESLFVFP